MSRTKESYKTTKEFIEAKFKQHNINKILVIQSVCYAIYDVCYVNGYRKHYKVFDDTLIIMAVICFDNILDYYEFFSKEDKLVYQEQYKIRIARKAA
jgi:hypothetical protein